MRSSLLALSLFLLSAPAAADLITGQIVDSNGVGVPGVNIDARDRISGDDAVLFNDGTDANGFFSTTIPAGLYRFTFKPPAPPVSTHLILETDEIVVAGTLNMGTIILPAGVSLTGQTVDNLGLPVSNVNLDVTDLMTGDDVLLQNDNTNAFGSFQIAVPATPIRVEFKTNNVLFVTLAPRAMDLTLGTNTSLGDVAFEPGFFLTGHVQTAGGQPIIGADTDVLDSTTGIQLFTPKDNTDPLGDFSVVVPAGTYDVEVCPPAGISLVGQELSLVSVFAATNTGITVLPNGVTLSGTVTDPFGAPVQNADVDVRGSVSGVAVHLCGDNTNAAGGYSVIVPTGTFDVTFSPAGGMACLGSDLHLGVAIPGNTVLNSTLPDVPDTFPPVITAPVIVGRAPKKSPFSRKVNFTVTVSDSCDPAPSLMCVPPSGSVFTFGVTTVTCTAMDASGNMAVKTFNVVVQPFVQRNL